VVIARGRHEDYLAHHPYPEDILLVVEIPIPHWLMTKQRS
jgi:hypothetical protein